MKRRLGLTILIVALLGAAACGDGEASASADGRAESLDVADEQGGSGERTVGAPDLSEQAAAAVREHGVPAFAIARVAADSSVTVGVAGRPSHESDVELGEDAPFHLGSDTKAMTAILLATFVEDGQLDLDSSLGELFAEVPLDAPVAATTLRDVLGHRAGLDDSTLDLWALHGQTDATQARAEAVTAAMTEPGLTPGEFAYANVNYMLAGAVAERTGGDTWENLLVERVFEPLDIACGFGAPRGPAVPVGHTAGGRPVFDDAPIADNPPALGPAGTVQCTMADWAVFAQSVLVGIRGEDSPVLSASAAADLFDDPYDYVAGWGRLEEGGQTIFTHDGSNTLWYARVVVAVERGEALLLASNTGEATAVRAMDELTEEFVAE